MSHSALSCLPSRKASRMGLIKSGLVGLVVPVLLAYLAANYVVHKELDRTSASEPAAQECE